MIIWISKGAFLGFTVIVPLVFLYLHAKRPKSEPFNFIEYQRTKCQSPIERRLFNALCYHGFDVRIQERCGPYWIDIALPSYRIAIECDGKAYHSTPVQKRS